MYFQSYTVILTWYLFAVSLISHWSLPPFFHVCWCEARGNFMVACGSHHFLSALIIPHSVFVINLVLCLFTFYTSLPPDGKRAPTAVGRGSPPRSRTGCDILSFWQSRGLRCESEAGCIWFNLIQPTRTTSKSIKSIVAFQSYVAVLATITLTIVSNAGTLF